jgi:hypothetical protein
MSLFPLRGIESSEHYYPGQFPSLAENQMSTWSGPLRGNFFTQLFLCMAETYA